MNHLAFLRGALAFVLSVHLKTLAADCPVAIDWALQNVGIKLPAAEKLISLYQQREGLKGFLSSGPRPAIRALIEGRYQEVEAYFAEVHSRSNASARADALANYYAQVSRGHLLLLDMTLDWRKMLPKSRAAQWAYGAMLADAGCDARGVRFFNETPDANIDRMMTRFVAAEALLAPLIQGDDEFSVHAMNLIAGMRMATGDSENGFSLLRKALMQAPRSRFLYSRYLNFASEKWVGEQARKEIDTLFSIVRKSGLDEKFVTELRQSKLSEEQRPDLSSDPTVRKAFWKQRVNELPSPTSLLGLARAEEYVRDWGAVVQTTDSLLKGHGTFSIAYYMRGRAHQNLGHNELAVDDYLVAVTLGVDGAMSQLIQAQLSGALGFKRLDVPALLELCRYGASLGLPAAANCMGGLYDEAQGLPRDAARSLGWHLRAARGGFTNSQHDIGSMAYTGSRGFKHEALGIYWLQRAAALGHAFAKRKLEQQISLPPPPQGCEGKPALARVTTL